MDRSTTFIMACLALFSTGCDQIGEQASKAVEQRVQNETDKLVDKAIGTVDKALDSVGPNTPKDGTKPKIITENSLQAAGISASSLTINESTNRVASVYCTFEKELDSSIEARFLTKTGSEIGRARQRIVVKAGAGQFVEFPIDPRTNINEILTVSVGVRKP